MAVELENYIENKILLGNSIRLVTNHICQERCSFCHNEGNGGVYTNTPLDIEEAVSFVARAKNEFGLTEVTLTGGEPSLFKGVENLIKQLKNNGLKVQITTNGDWEPVFLNKLISTGLDVINFSLHAVNAQDFWVVQGEGKFGRSLRWCDWLIQRKTNNILQAKDKVSTKINTVVISKDITGRVVNFAFHHRLDIRLMRDLNKVEISEKIIQEIIEEKELVLSTRVLSTGDSSNSYSEYAHLKNPALRLKVKRFSDVYLESLCGNCSFRHKSSCRERFYGIRLEPNPKSGELQVRLCIDRHDPQAVMAIKDFWKSNHIAALKSNYDQGFITE